MKVSTTGLTLCSLFLILITIVAIFLDGTVAMYLVIWPSHPISQPVATLITNTFGIADDRWFTIVTIVSLILNLTALYLGGSLIDSLIKKLYVSKNRFPNRNNQNRQ